MLPWAILLLSTSPVVTIIKENNFCIWKQSEEVFLGNLIHYFCLKDLYLQIESQYISWWWAEPQCLWKIKVPVSVLPASAVTGSSGGFNAESFRWILHGLLWVVQRYSWSPVIFLSHPAGSCLIHQSNAVGACCLQPIPISIYPLYVQINEKVITLLGKKKVIK